MALSTYSELVGSISTWLDGSDLGGREADLIRLTEAEINSRLAALIEQGQMIRPMMQTDPITIDAEYADLPDGGTIITMSLEITGLDRPWQVRYVDPDALIRMRFGQQEERRAVASLVGAEAPRFYTLIGDQIRFLPAPESVFAGNLMRQVKVPALSEDMPSNWLLSSHPNAYLYGALAQAELLGWNDGRMANLAALFADAVDGIAARYPAPSSHAPLRSALSMAGGGTYSNFVGDM